MDVKYDASFMTTLRGPSIYQLFALSGVACAGGLEDTQGDQAPQHAPGRLAAGRGLRGAARDEGAAEGAEGARQGDPRVSSSIVTRIFLKGTIWDGEKGGKLLLLYVSQSS